MTHENSWTILERQRALRRGDIVGKRGQRVLNDGNAMAALRELVIDSAPARAIRESAMHQYYIPDGFAVRRVRCTSCVRGAGEARCCDGGGCGGEDGGLDHGLSSCLE